MENFTIILEIIIIIDKIIGMKIEDDKFFI